MKSLYKQDYRMCVTTAEMKQKMLLLVKSLDIFDDYPNNFIIASFKLHIQSFEIELKSLKCKNTI